MNRLSKLLILAIPAIASCADGHFVRADRHWSAEQYGGSNAGFVVVGVGAEKAPTFDYSGVSFQRRGTDAQWSTRYSPKRFMMPGDESDYESKRESGRVQVWRLAPGEYDLVSAYVGQSATKFPYECTKTMPPDVSFTLRAGEIVYLGRYTLTTWRGNCLQLSLSEGDATDIETARSRNKELPAGEARLVVPEQRKF